MENQFLIENNINAYVKLYSKRILNDLEFYIEDEAYKYRAVSIFQKKFNLEALNLAEMLEEALPKSKETGSNLVQSGNYMPKKMLLEFAREDANFVRKLLSELLSEHESTDKRIDNFIDEIHKKFPLTDRHYYIDARFLSFFLAANSPDKYFYIKYDEYRKVAQMIGYDLNTKGSQGDKYRALSELAEIIRDILKNSKEFNHVHKLIVENFDFKDTSLSWGPYDFIFDVARREGGQVESVKKKIKEQTKVVDAKNEASEEFLLEDEVVDEINEKTKDKILIEAQEFRPKNDSGYKHKIGEFTVRIDNVRQKTRVKSLEDYICQVCGFTFEFLNSEGKKRKYAEADHIIEKSDGGTEEIGNLWILCANCHMKKTLGVINIDPTKKIVSENGKIIEIRDNHLGWNK